MTKGKYPQTKTLLTQKQVDAVKEFLSSELVEHMIKVGAPNSFDGLLMTVAGFLDRDRCLNQMLTDEKDKNSKTLRKLGKDILASVGEQWGV